MILILTKQKIFLICLHVFKKISLIDNNNKGKKTMNYWLIKSEPSCFSIDDMKEKKTDSWDGVRNYTARNLMKNGAW